MKQPSLVGKLAIWLSEHRKRRLSFPLHKFEAYINPNYLTHFYLASDLYLTFQNQGITSGEVLEKVLETFEISISENPCYPYSYFNLGIFQRHKAKILMSEEGKAEENRYIQALNLLQNSRKNIEISASLDSKLKESAERNLLELPFLEKQCHLYLIRQN